MLPQSTGGKAQTKAGRFDVVQSPALSITTIHNTFLITKRHHCTWQARLPSHCGSDDGADTIAGGRSAVWAQAGTCTAHAVTGQRQQSGDARCRAPRSCCWHPAPCAADDALRPGLERLGGQPRPNALLQRRHPSSLSPRGCNSQRCLKVRYLGGRPSWTAAWPVTACGNTQRPSAPSCGEPVLVNRPATHLLPGASVCKAVGWFLVRWSPLGGLGEDCRHVVEGHEKKHNVDVPTP